MASIHKARPTPERLPSIQERPMPELVDRVLFEREVGQLADEISAYLIYRIGRHVYENNLGIINGSQGSYRIFSEADRVRIPSISFTKRERLAPGGLAKGHARIAPDLVVEVIFPRQKAEALECKLDDFLAVGVPLVWVVYPGFNFVRVRRPNERTEQEIRTGGLLDGGDVLPGFRCAVAELFDRTRSPNLSHQSQ